MKDRQITCMNYTTSKQDQGRVLEGLQQLHVDVPVAVLSPIFSTRSWICVFCTQEVAVHAAWHPLLETPLERVFILRGLRTCSCYNTSTNTPETRSVKHKQPEL